ncbi:MAG: hypothetical protein ACI8S6_002335 [Myxococcota bacterium]|jgi:hypothetical protein
MRASVALLLFACNSDFELQKGADGNTPSPALGVAPSVMSLEAPLGESASDIVTLYNDGDAAMALLGAEISTGARFTVGALATDRLAPGESTELVVTFEALVTTEEGLLRVYSDDPDLGSVEVPLYGRALTPLLTVSPNPIALGSRTVGCDWDQRVDLINDGDADLTVEAVLASGERFSLAESTDLPQVLAPDASTSVTVRFSPQDPVASVGNLLVGSDDPGGDRFVSITGTGAAAALTEQAFQQGFDVREEIDILVYIDKSGSMGDDNSRLKDNAADFMSQLSALSTDYQIMVVTADFGCHNEGIITPATADPVGVFSRALDGPSGGYTEAGLSVTLKALEASGSGECNAGFLRDDVALSVLLISDEPEQSPAGWEETLAELLAVEPDTIISAIAGDYPDGCETADAGDGYYQAVSATGGVFLSICETDWSPHIEAISDISTKVPGELTDTFTLSSYPDPDTIVVTVDGAPSSAWSYDSDLNAIVFDEMPADEANIYVTFTRGCG